MPINVWLPEVIQDRFSPSLCTIIKWKTTELLGNMVCSANQLLYSCLGLVWISYQTVSGALLCSCQLFAPSFSAIDSLQECSSLFEKPKGGTAFAGYAVGRHLCMYPYFDCCFYFSNSFAVLAGHLCEFHTKQWGERCSVPVSCLAHAFLQSVVCRSAVHCFKSQRVVLL
jgi:hypothetical protein